MSNDSASSEPQAEIHDNVTLAEPHVPPIDEVLFALEATRHGLSRGEAADRLQRIGPNALPQPKPPSAFRVFLRQFSSPLIYVLVLAALVSMLIREWSDAVLIAAVLLVNAIIGTLQEYSAQRAAEALNQLVKTKARVLRDGDAFLIDSEELVPGDVVRLESGDKIPADMRLLAGRDLEVDESLLTGESETVMKDDEAVMRADSALGDRANMVFAGTMVSRGRQHAIVVKTATDTELGKIATGVLTEHRAKAPLIVRMERFTQRIAIAVAVASLTMAAIALTQGTALDEVFLLAVALAVSAIPEGLPVALTVALAIGMQRMARRNVIVRRLVAVEALGSCTFIATDKTGTLTENQLAVRRIDFPDTDPWEVTGEATEPSGSILTAEGSPSAASHATLARLSRAAVLANDGFLGRRDEDWITEGDAVDVALLIMAHKAGRIRAETVNAHPEVAAIPFESERQFCASLNTVNERKHAFVKGAFERVLTFCSSMAAQDRDAPLDAAHIEAQAEAMASEGYRVIALAGGEIALDDDGIFTEEHLSGLTFLGLVGIIDPLRTEAKAAVTACREAGIEVAMVTGDHPTTAATIARELDLIQSSDQVVTGPMLKTAEDEAMADAIVKRGRVFARVEPQQKLEIVQSLQRNGYFVAVSGDGANDAPALRAAQVGVAMGQGGTDVARETADIIITDDNFASIVAGVEEGRIAYANVRKVIFLLISTGAAELVLFALALLSGLPLPLVAVQLLWLNLVTNGIQDVALAFEPGEGDELSRPPRSPREPVFNRLMIERVVISALVMGAVAFACFKWLLESGFTVDEARNSTLLLMVLFENVNVFNSRSETRSVFRHNLLRNKLLLAGTLIAQLIHIGAMYTPWISDVLHIQPVSLEHWATLLVAALSILVVMEIYKAVHARLRRDRAWG
ncbi:MAG: HAD-IC family P-type ATPase [Paracoccaceae bacterium]|nr:HAD-IC family P-type ATPase [Paracoccaceae bacterium]